MFLHASGDLSSLPLTVNMYWAGQKQVDNLAAITSSADDVSTIFFCVSGSFDGREIDEAIIFPVPGPTATSWWRCYQPGIDHDRYSMVVFS